MMPDNEKMYFANGKKYTMKQMVETGINQCLMLFYDEDYETQCADCPYYDPDVEYPKCKDFLREDALKLLKEQSKVKTYGKLYSISSKVAIEQKNELEKKLYEDICKCLMENSVLTIYSENIIPCVEVTYGWKLKGVAQTDA